MKILQNSKKKAIEIARRLRVWAFKNWVKYTILKSVFFSGFFILFYFTAFVIGWFSLLLFLLIPLFFILDSKRPQVAYEIPAKFIKAEEIEQALIVLFYLIYPSWIVFTVFYGNAGRLGISDQFLPLLYAIWLLLLLIGTGLFLGVEINAIESSNFLKRVKQIRIPKRLWHLFEFYPSETIRARARFVVLLEYLSSSHSEKAISRRFSLFHTGIKIYNEHLRENFGFVLCEPKRFSNQARLFALSGEKAEEIRLGLQVLTEALEDEKKKPFEIVRLLKEMLNEPASFNDVCAEIDSEPKRIRKWLSKHSTSLIGIGSLIAGAIAAIPIIMKILSGGTMF